MERFWQDVRYGWRMLRKSPGNTVVAVLSLALGLGASTALFSVYDAVILRPLPVAEPEQLIFLAWEANPGPGVMDSHSGYRIPLGPGKPSRSGSFSYPMFLQIRDLGVLESTFAFYPVGRTNVQADGNSELASALMVSGDYFTGLGLRPAAGGFFTQQDDTPGTGVRPAVIAYNYWHRRFGGNAAAIGKTVFVNGDPFTIAGVLPQGFDGTVDMNTPPDVYLPLTHIDRLRPTDTNLLTNAEQWMFRVMGRLKPGTTRASVEPTLRAAFQRHVETRPRVVNVKPGEKPPSIPWLVVKPGAQGQSEFRQRNAQPLLFALAVAGLIVLIACGNVANLLLAKAGARQREIAVRMALGSQRGRLIRQLLTESLLLAGMGGLTGVVLAWWGKGVLFAWLPVSNVSTTLEIPLDLRVLAFSGAACVLTAVIFGLAPAFHATRVDLANSLKDAAGSVTGSRARQRLGKAMVVAQLAVSLVVLNGAGLFLRTLVNLEKSGTGFNPENLLTFRLDGPLSGYTDERLADLYDDVRRRAERLPGVRSVGTTRHPLISNTMANRSASFPGYTPKPDENVYVWVHQISGDFFGTLQAPLVLGRAFDERDNHRDAPPVAIVNEAVARTYFAGANPVGQRMDFGRAFQGGKLEIVGVVRDMKYDGLRNEPPPTVYTPARQSSAGDVTFMVRTAGNPMELATAVRAMVRELDANLPVFGLRTQNDLIHASLDRERESSSLFALFAGLALLLAGIGLYGLMAHSVATRTNEIGIRVALGATGGDIFRMVLTQGSRLIALGVAIGLTGAWWATRLLEAQLFGVKPNDPLTLAGVSLVLAAAALTACFVPARRATRVNPIVALRYE